jgi:HK97 family phage portal protein
MASDKSPAGETKPRGRSRARRGKPGEDVHLLRLVHNGRTKSATGELTVSGLLAVSNLDTKAHVTRPYEEDGWIHACVKAKGQAVSSVPLQIWMGDPGKDKDAKLLDPADPLSRLFQRPMPHMTGAQFFEASAHHRMLDGEDFWFLLDKDGKPVKASLKIPMPRYILPIRGGNVGLVQNSESGWPEKWIGTRRNALALEAPAQSVIQFRDYNIDDPFRGLGDGEALYRDIDLSWQAYRYQSAILRNSGDPGGFIKTEQTLAPAEQEAAENDAEESFSVGNAGKWKVVSGKGVEFVPNKLGPRDMDFPKLLAWNRDKILGVMGVPPPFLGVLEFATLANFVESVRMFWQGGNGILPYLHAVEDVVTNLFLRDLAHPKAAVLFARFDTSGIEALQADRNLQLDIVAKLVVESKGAVSFEEACALVGVDIESAKLEYGKVHFMPAGMTTAERVIEDATNPPDTTPPADPAAAGDGSGDAGDAGKSTAAASEDEPARKVIATRDEEPLAPDPVEVARAARREYWSTKEAKLLRQGEKVLRSKYRSWRKDYERAQYARLRDFAADGEAALREPSLSKKDGPNDQVPFDDLNPSTFNVDPLLLPKHDQATRFVRKFTDPMKGIWADALEDIAQELGAEFPLLPSDPGVLAALDSQLIKLAGGHVEFLGERVKSALLEELSKATNQANLQAAVEEVLPALTENLKNVFGDRGTRANTIARTEVARATNQARNMEMVRTGISSTEWVSQHDSAVRGSPGGPYEDAEFSHYELDGKTAHIGTLFDGEKHPGLKYPGDPEAQPGDTINCRCLNRPVQTKDTNQ